jgi:TRAP-type C4-dicarboxylate transport system substrate-binding protein
LSAWGERNESTHANRRLVDQEQRKNGAFEIFERVYNRQMNVHYLGRWGQEVPFHVYLTKKIDGADLSGMRIRGVSVYQPLITALGGTMITTSPGEAYTALERGIVDGYGWPLWGIQDWGWDKVTKYRVDPGFYSVDLSTLVNLDVWKKLTPEQQEVLTATAKHMEDDYVPKIVAETNAAQKKIQADAGIQVVELTGADLKKYQDAAQASGWAVVLKLEPELGPKIRDLTTK